MGDPDMALDVASLAAFAHVGGSRIVVDAHLLAAGITVGYSMPWGARQRGGPQLRISSMDPRGSHYMH